MSVTEMSSRESEFERTPPHDLAAEQCVLGSMLISQTAIAEVIELLQTRDFYRPAHQTVYERVLDLYGRGDPVDAITVKDELLKRGELSRIGDAPYLHTLVASVPTAANAGYYAKIVEEKAILRRLVEVGTRIAQMGYSTDGADADDLLDRAQAEVYAVADKRTGEDYAPLSDIMPGALDEIEAIGSRGGQMVGVPTGFTDLDALTNGLHPGQMVIIAARPAIGKALALDTPLPTPTGWTTMGDVRVGDELLGADGRPATVTAATPVLHGRTCYEVEFSDGTVIVADAAHQWLTETRAARKAAQAAATGYNRYRDQATFPSVKTTQEIAETLRCGTADNRLNHAVSVAKPTALREADLPLSPYAMGVWLGAGHSAEARFTTADPEIVQYLENEGLRVVPNASHPLTFGLRLPEPPAVPERHCVVCGATFVPRTSQVRTCGRVCGGRSRGIAREEPTCPDCGESSSGLAQCRSCRDRSRAVQAILRTLGVLGNKHIPVEYLRASEEQRRALLAGLLDTDGYVNKTGTVQFAVTNSRLASDTLELILSLGYRATMKTKAVKGRSLASATCYQVTFTPSDKVFRLTRKLARQTTRAYPTTLRRYITDVRLVPSVPVRCVEVDNEDHLYLASRAWIPTHNSTLALDLARAAAIKHQLATVVFSLEMGRNEITMRLLSAEARVALHSMRSGSMNDEDWTRLARRMSEVAEAPLFIDDSPNMSMMEIRAKCRRLKQQHDLRMVIIDYLQLMQSGKRVESRQVEVSEFSRSLKLLAKELEVPVIALSQLNRGPEQRTDKKPMVSDLRESGCLTAETRILRADTGAEVALGDLLAAGERDVPVWSLDEKLRLIPRTMTHVFSSGSKEVFRVRLRSGREVNATANHPFLTHEGWRALGDLAAGSRVAVPRHAPAPLQTVELPDAEVTLLARLVGDGSTAGGLPQEVFSLPKRQLAAFLRHLWAAGHVQWDEETAQARISYGSASRRLVDDVARLLLRFNVMTRIEEDGHRLFIHGADNQLRFLADIGVQAEHTLVRDKLALLKGATHLDTVPGDVWDRVRSALQEQRAPAFSAGAAPRPSERRLGTVAEILDDADLEMLATNDVFWDEIASIESIGVREVYDATVLGTHNFVADGICLHNSIEQDADVVILLHREDAYEKESPRAGEADLIVAKHRNGPTATVTVAFQGHYSRFVDMAH